MIINIEDDTWLINHYKKEFMESFRIIEDINPLIKFSSESVHVNLLGTGKEITISYKEYEQWQDTLPEN